MNKVELEEALDKNMLNQYIEVIGVDTLLKSALMLEGMLGEHEISLKQCLLHQNLVGLRQQAHQIKGAAGTLGLKRVQYIADRIQTKEALCWYVEDEHNLQLMLTYLKQDVQLLLEYFQSL